MLSKNFQSSPTLEIPFGTTPQILIFMGNAPDVHFHCWCFIFSPNKGAAKPGSLPQFIPIIAGLKIEDPPGECLPGQPRDNCVWLQFVCSGKPGVTWEFITRKAQDSCHPLMAPYSSKCKIYKGNLKEMTGKSEKITKLAGKLIEALGFCNPQWLIPFSSMILGFHWNW